VGRLLGALRALFITRAEEQAHEGVRDSNLRKASEERRVRDVPPSVDEVGPLRGALMIVILALTGCSSASSQKEAKVRPLPEPGQTLRPGEYRPEEFEPSLSFHVGKGWSAFEEHASVDFAISMQGETRWVGLTNVQEVYKPITKGTSTVESKVVEAPEDLVGWFQEHPYLKTSEPESVSVGGIKGEQFDMVVEVPGGYYGACGTDCMDIFRLGGEEPLGEQDGNKIRIIVLEDVNGDTLCFGNGVREASEFDEFMTEAQKVVDSVKWRDR
jgi:hypothetical protein